jgi:predicted amidohydrolase YtcJ
VSRSGSVTRHLRDAAWLILALGGVSGACAAQTPRTPDLILLDGKVFTSDSTRPWVQALAIRGDRIVAVGTTAEIALLAGPRTRRLPLGGKVVIPGFNDAHDHVGSAEYGVSFMPSSAPTPDPDTQSILAALRASAAHAPGRSWLHAVVGSRALDDPALRREALDRAAAGHPVLLWGWTGHGVLLNTAGLHALEIADDVRDPIGGRYERDAAGRLTGALTDYAEWSALRRLYSSLPTSALVKSLRQYAADGLALGVTSVQDMNGYLDPAATDRALRAARLPIRFRVIPYPMTDATGLEGDEWRTAMRREGARHPAPLSVVSGVKWILDGTPIDRGALMRAPYADQPGWYGQLQFPADTVRAILALALATREPLHLHMSGDSTPRLVFALMETLAPDSAWRSLRVRVEHGDWVSGDLLNVARRLGVVIVENPTHFALDSTLVKRRFGRVPREMFAARSVVSAGVPFGFGSDGPRNPFVNVMFAVTNPNNPSEALTREQAVVAYTRGSAYAEFAEREKGTLAPGMLADLAVLSQDVFVVPVAAIPMTTSVLTLVGGRIVYDARKTARH